MNDRVNDDHLSHRANGEENDGMYSKKKKEGRIGRESYRLMQLNGISVHTGITSHAFFHLL